MRFHIVHVALVLGALRLPVGVGAAGARPPETWVYEPVPAEGIRIFYANGVPAAVVSSPAVPAVLTLEVTRIASKRYLRVWAYVLNAADSTIELTPQAQFIARSIARSGAILRRLEPQTPTQVLKLVDSEKNAAQAGLLFSGILSGLAGTLDPHETRAGMLANEQLYESMKRNTSAALLRRNTLDHDMSVNGYLYFAGGAIRRHDGVTSFGPAEPDEEGASYVVSYSIAGQQTDVTFRLVPGE